MGEPRKVALFDADAEGGAWCEKMQPGEYAVHYSGLNELHGTTPYCTVFASLPEAMAHAQQTVEAQPAINCRIYDERGFVGAPIQEIRGSAYKDGGMSARFRRWVGSVLFFGALALIVFDWLHDFRLSWPAMIGIRMLFPGLVLLAIEAVLVVQERRRRGA